MARRQIGNDAARMSRLLSAVARYQQHPWARDLAPMPVVAAAGAVTVRDYGGSGRPTFFVPSLINPPTVLDLAAERSLLRWLAARGVRPLLVDWGRPGREERSLGVLGYVRERLEPLVLAIGERVDLVGYCLGGTMALAAAGALPVRSVATIAAPWDFGGFPEQRRLELADYWRRSLPVVEAIGEVPMDVIQPAFWSLDPASAVAKFEKFAAMDAASETARTFIAVEDWANDGPSLSLPAARESIEDLYIGNASGKGLWCDDPAATGKPILTIASRTDRIVPATTAPPFGERIDLAAGHVGMIVGSAAREQLWEPLLGWLRR